MTKFIVSIDTEEEGLWGGSFDPRPTTENLRGLERFQSFCEGSGITPTYLVDAPVVEDEWAVGRLRAWQEHGSCEVGAHCHPWCNPPQEGRISSSRESYLCNLPASVQRQKLCWLTDEIANRIGRRPTSFRAGRYGLDAVGAGILADLGYLVDSSVLPFRSYRSEGGPDFRRADTWPYRVANNDLLKADAQGTLLEVPITSGFTKRGFRTRHRVRSCLVETPLRHTRMAGVLDRLGVLRLVKLSPEQTDIRDAKRLVSASLKQGAEVLVLMFHSTSLLPGFSPYVKNTGDLEAFYSWLGECFRYCLDECRCESVTLTEFAQQWSEEHSVAAASGA